MKVEEFLKMFEAELNKKDIDEEDKKQVIAKVIEYLDGKKEVTQQDMVIVKRVVMPSVLWRGW